MDYDERVLTEGLWWLGACRCIMVDGSNDYVNQMDYDGLGLLGVYWLVIDAEFCHQNKFKTNNFRFTIYLLSVYMQASFYLLCYKKKTH